MSTIEELAQEVLKSAQAEGANARRVLWVAVGLLAFIHLLTVQPYLETAVSIAGLEKTMATNKSLLTQLEPEIATLQRAGHETSKRLRALLDNSTQKMLPSFLSCAS